MRLQVRVEERLSRRRVDAVLQVRPRAPVAERPRVQRDDGSVVEQRTAGIAEADALSDLEEPVREGILRRDRAHVAVAPNAVEDSDRLRRSGATGNERI